MVDVTPGGAALAKACLKNNVQYFGIVRKKAHASWISNIVDLEAIRVITMNKHALYQQSLSDLIQEFFKEELSGSDEPEKLTAEEIAAMNGEEGDGRGS